MTPDKQLLQHLSSYGIGTWVDISDYLKVIFPVPVDSTQWVEYKMRVKAFIDALIEEGFIAAEIRRSYSNDRWGNAEEHLGFGEALFPIKASIKREGMEYLHRQSPQSSVVNNYAITAGDGSQINQGSEKASIEVKKSTKRESKDLAEKIKKWIIVGSSIIALAVAGFKAIIYYEDHFTKNDSTSNKQQTNSSIKNDATSINMTAKKPDKNDSVTRRKPHTTFVHSVFKNSGTHLDTLIPETFVDLKEIYPLFPDGKPHVTFLYDSFTSIMKMEAELFSKKLQTWGYPLDHISIETLKGNYFDYENHKMRVKYLNKKGPEISIVFDSK